MLIFDFTQAGSADAWRSVDDRVMGGISRSEMVWVEEFASFRGVVSAENNGGFCSVRARLPTSLNSATDHLWIESRGDLKLYSISLRTNKTLDGINYQADMHSTANFTRIELPLTEFKPEFRGRAVNGAPELIAEDIQQLGILISDQQYGDFELDIKAIGTMS